MNDDLPSLDIVIATYLPTGISRVADMIMPETPGIKYVVSWQSHENKPIPESLTNRSDVMVLRLDGKGLSANRNNALNHCSSDIIYITDDDVTLFPEAIREMRIFMKNNSGIDLCTFRSQHGDMSRFPSKQTLLHQKLPKGYYVSSIEIVIRRSKCSRLRFCPGIGIGANSDLQAGEDDLFLLSAIKHGLECQFYPLTICAHPQESSGNKKKLSPHVMMASGCVIALYYPLTAPLRGFLKAWRVYKNRQSSLIKAVYYITKGMLKSHGLLKRNRETLW